MTLPEIRTGIDISATGGAGAYGTGASVGTSPYNKQMADQYADSRDSSKDKAQKNFGEIGFPGLLTFGQFVQAAYQRELYWPGVFPLYNRLRRSDPEVTVIRQIFSAVAGSLEFKWQGPEKPNDDDKRAQAFAESALTDLDGGVHKFIDTLVSHVPFMGWGWWELVPGLRRKGWTPPDFGGEPDPWRSRFDDGLTGFRRLAFRDHSSFQGWEISNSGRLLGMKQLAMPHPMVTLPLNRSVHITFGDTANPEGLTPLEGLWRLERIKYGLEVVQGIGYEHAAGYLNVNKTTEGEITPTDTANIRKAARAVLTAQEGNYAAWPQGFAGKVEDVPFTAGSGLMEAIRYYGLLKLALFNAQWVGMSSITDKGSYSALHDASSTWMVFFNAMMAGFAGQLDDQLGARLFEQNPLAFPKMTERPHLTITPVEKFIELDKLGTFWAAIKDTMPTGPEDFLELRRKSGFLPEVLPKAAGGPAAGKNTDAHESVDDSEADALDDNENPALSGFMRHRSKLRTISLSLPPQTLTHLQAGYAGDVRDHRTTVYNAVLQYLVQSGANASTFKNMIGQSVLETFPNVFYGAYRAGGAEDVDPSDDAWLTTRENTELANVKALFQNLKDIKVEELPPAELVAEANRRADGYAASLRDVFSQGLLRGQKNKMLTMVGVDGKESCRDCQANSGKRFSARKWLRVGIPGVPGNGYECGGWNCRHGLQDDSGAMWTISA